MTATTVPTAAPAVEVDPGRATATVRGRATWVDVLTAAQRHGLAPVPAHDLDGDVVAGVRGGGLGWLARAHGPGRDRLRDAVVVTPGGVVVRAADDPGLLWALRGGGPLGPVDVASVVLDLVPVPCTAYAGDLRYPATMAAEVVARWAEWAPALPPAMTTAVVLVGRSAAIVRGVHLGPVAEGRALVDTWRSWAQPVADRFTAGPLAALARLDDRLGGDLVAPAMTTEWLRGLPDPVADVLRADGPEWVEVRHVGGALGRARRRSGPEPAGATDLLLRAGARTAHPLAVLRRALAAAEATTGGTLLGAAGPDEFAARRSTAFDAATLARLDAVAAALVAAGR